MAPSCQKQSNSQTPIDSATAPARVHCFAEDPLIELGVNYTLKILNFVAHRSRLKLVKNTCGNPNVRKIYLHRVIIIQFQSYTGELWILIRPVTCLFPWLCCKQR